MPPSVTVGAAEPGAAPPAPTRRLRSDARDNRARLLAAALEVFVEQGPGAPLEEISRRAGTGIATLYRRFPDRRALMTAVVLDALVRTAEEARLAAEEAPEPFDALVRYMHRALDIRTAAVIPAILQEIPFDEPDLARAREESARRVQELVDAAHRTGSLHPDVTSGDIGMLVVRLSRPLPGPIDRELNDRLAHRHLDLLINGLRPTAAGHDTPTAKPAGPAFTLADLNAMRRASRPDAESDLK